MVNGVVQELLSRTNASGPAGIYCMAALVAEEASQSGCAGLAKSIEAALEEFLKGLPRDQQRQALRLSYELTIAASASDAEPAPPRLRLVYSRD